MVFSRIPRSVLAACLVAIIGGTPVGADISRPADGAGVGGGGDAAAPATPTPGGGSPIARPADPAAPTPTPREPAPGPVTPPPPPPPGPVTPPPVPPPPPPEPIKKISYYIIINGQQAGPFNEAELKAKVASGALVRGSLVWTEGMQNWEEAGKVADLVQVLASTPPKPQFDAMAYLSGTWQADPQQIQIPNVGPGTMNSRVTYRRDGSYSFFGTIDAVVGGYPARQMITSDGTFTAKEQGPGKILITPNGQITYSMQGQTPSTGQNNTPFAITVLDRNTTASDDGVRSRRISN